MDADGVADAGEPGIPGVRVELWKDTDGNTANGAEQLVGWTFTDAIGHFYFSGQPTGDYRLVVSSANFGAGMPLQGSGFSSPVTVAADNGVDDDDNGTQPGGAGTPAYSPMIHLQAGTEPTGNAITGAERGRGGDIDDFVNDVDGDMTVDFGFVEPGELGIGNLVL